jgi:4-hydroxysphinganine ceramide fatty acyl 2-hydroxylase
MSYRGQVYDVTPFLADHPGGDDIMLEYAGKDVGVVMGDEDSHVHSRSAYDMMEDYRVGELGGDEKIVSEGESACSTSISE